MNLTSAQERLISRLWLAALIEALGDSFVDSVNIWDTFSTANANAIHGHSKAYARKIRGKHPRLLDIHDIIAYATKKHKHETE